MRVRRRFKVALFVTLVFAACYLAIPRTIDAIHRIEQRHALALAQAAFSDLRVPSSFIAVHSGCAFYPCYVVPEPPSRAELALPAILASIHAQWRNVLESTSRPSGPVPGCSTARRHGREFTSCAILGTIDGQLITLDLSPYSARSPSHWTNASLIAIAGPQTTP